MNRGDTKYHVTIVEDDALPADQSFAFLECDGQLWLALRRTEITEHVLEDAWDVYHEMGKRTSESAGGHTPVPGCCPLAGHRATA